MSSQDSLRALPTPDPEVLAALGRVDGKKKRSTRLVRFAVVGVVLAGLVAGGVRLNQMRAAANAPVWKTEVLARGDIRVTVAATGTLEGQNTVEVGSEVSGKLTEVKVTFSDPVRVGQVLAIIDPEQP
ncbi:MAG TPA: biotin/lipoyl-binding protein, partial [Polyangiaceae bacterium]|nr:biotin/lipoyl-binding protein [Polyangiaceae bacterium]